jgi:hypothetical protein
MLLHLYAVITVDFRGAQEELMEAGSRLELATSQQAALKDAIRQLEEELSRERALRSGTNAEVDSTTLFLLYAATLHMLSARCSL